MEELCSELSQEPALPMASTMDCGMEIPRREWYLQIREEIPAMITRITSVRAKVKEWKLSLLIEILESAYCWCWVHVNNSFMRGVGFCIHSWGSFVT